MKESVLLHKPQRIGLVKWETRVETPRCTWYFHGLTRASSQRQAMAQFKELTKDELHTE